MAKIASLLYPRLILSRKDVREGSAESCLAQACPNAHVVCLSRSTAYLERPVCLVEIAREVGVRGVDVFAHLFLW